METPSRLPPPITAFEMQRRPAAFQRRVLETPVTITSNGEPTIVAMSVAEYQRLQAQAAASREGDDQSVEAVHAGPMQRSDAFGRILEHREELAKLGVAHVSLYGSVARDQAGALSDVDVIVDTEDGQAPGLFRLAQISDQLELILGRPVDVISRRGLEHTKTLKRRVAADLVHVF